MQKIASIFFVIAGSILFVYAMNDYVQEMQASQLIDWHEWQIKHIQSNALLNSE